MSGNLNAAMKLYLQQAQMRLHLVSRISWPIGTHLYTEEGGPAVGSASLGVHLPIISGMDSVRRVVSDRDGGLQGVETSIDLSDADKVISNALASRYGDQMEGSAVVTHFAPGDTGILPAAWAPVFAGIVEQINFKGSRAVTLKVRANDLALRRQNLRQRVSLGVWPHAANDTSGGQPAVLDQYVPIYFGKWDSRSAGGGGAVECLNVDNRAGPLGLWIWQQGAAKRVLAAYHTPNDVRTLLAPSTYSFVHETRGGVTYSGLRRTAVGGRWTAPVTVDFEGLTDQGDGSGDLVENPAEQIALWLNAFVYGDFKSGDYPASAPIDALYLADTATFFDEQGIKGSLYITQPESAQNVLDRWASTFPFVRLFWTFRNSRCELAIRHRDWRTYPYVSDPLLRWITEDDGTKMVPARIRRSRVDRYVARYLTLGANGSTRSLAVKDSSLGYDASEDLQMPFALAALG